MKLFNKQILEAINRGILLALDDYEDSSDKISPQKDLITRSDKLHEEIIETVNLGLPSGTIWLKCNLGCNWSKLLLPEKTKPEDWYGNYYAWGEVETKQKYTKGNYIHGIKMHYDYDCVIPAKYGENRLVLELIDDAAYLHNHKFKIPSKELFKELIEYTTEKYVSNYKGVVGLNGRLFTSKINGNQLFIPMAGGIDESGKYSQGLSALNWSSEHLSNIESAWYLHFTIDLENKEHERMFGSKPVVGSNNTYRGFTIRPVLRKE